MKTLALELWEQFGRLTLDSMPEPATTVATHCILDWFGCAIGGVNEPVARILRDELGGVAGTSSVLGADTRTGAQQAAMINGATGHALDYDDTHTAMGGHPTAPVLPAALAMAEERDASGADLLTAFVVGSEVEHRLGIALGPQPYARGWHTTSLIGVFGATAAASHMIGLDEPAFVAAMGIAASQASGLKANFGSMTKPLHAGQAAERGVLAARLAARGLTASFDAIEASQGLAAATGAGELRQERLAAVHDEWLVTRTLFKHHAACYLTHAAIESALVIRSTIASDDVSRVTVMVHPSLLDVCAIPTPATGLEAKFSLRATTAMALLGLDTADPATFDDTTATQPDVQKLLSQVEVITDATLLPTAAQVEVTAHDGRRAAADADTGVAATDLSHQGDRLRRKFDALARPVLGADAADGLATRIGELGSRNRARALLGSGTQRWKR